MPPVEPAVNPFDEATVIVAEELAPVELIEIVCDVPKARVLVLAETLKFAPDATVMIGELPMFPEPLNAKVPLLILVLPL